MIQHEMEPDLDVCTKCEMTETAIMEYAIKCGQKWEKRGRRITMFATGEVEYFKSLNEAKKASRKLQGARQGYAGMRRLRI